MSVLALIVFLITSILLLLFLYSTSRDSMKNTLMLLGIIISFDIVVALLVWSVLYLLKVI